MKNVLELILQELEHLSGPELHTIRVRIDFLGSVEGFKDEAKKLKTESGPIAATLYVRKMSGWSLQDSKTFMETL